MKPYSMMDQLEREAFMRSLAESLDERLTSSVGHVCFTLIVWPEKDGALSNYISNGERAEIIDALRETVDRLESRQDQPPIVGNIQ